MRDKFDLISQPSLELAMTLGTDFRTSEKNVFPNHNCPVQIGSLIAYMNRNKNAARQTWTTYVFATKTISFIGDYYNRWNYRATERKRVLRHNFRFIKNKKIG
jgi:hypothetical protein